MIDLTFWWRLRHCNITYVRCKHIIEPHEKQTNNILVIPLDQPSNNSIKFHNKFIEISWKRENCLEMKKKPSFVYKALEWTIVYFWMPNLHISLSWESLLRFFLNKHPFHSTNASQSNAWGTSDYYTWVRSRLVINLYIVIGKYDPEWIEYKMSRNAQDYL